MKYAIVKYNGGLGALLCNNCNTIISEGTKHTDKHHLCFHCLAKDDVRKRFDKI